MLTIGSPEEGAMGDIPSSRSRQGSLASSPMETHVPAIKSGP